MGDTVPVVIEWNKQKFDLEVDFTKPVDEFKTQIYSLTRVPPERQKVMMPGGALKDDLSKFRSKITPGKRIMVMGTPEETSIVVDTGKKTVFVEDLPPEVQHQSLYPPGLVNIGNTCYMNSSLQTIRAIPELKSGVLSFVPRDEEMDTIIDHTARNLFQKLESSNIAVMPGEFWMSFTSLFEIFKERDDKGNLRQHDAEEFWTLFLQCLRKLPPLTNGIKANNLVEQLFQGTLIDELKCSENEEEPVTSNISYFEKITCHIGNETTNLHQSLEKSMVESIEKNSPSLNRDCIYTKSSKISKLPFYLTIQFVRFFWKKEKNIRNKIVKPVDFPFDLDMYTYCTPEFKETIAAYRDEKNENPPKPEKYQNISGRYELVAVISHKGRDAEGGHYVSWVKQEENYWLQYEDDTVTPRDREYIKKLTGDEGADWHIAYMCLYRTKQ